MSEVNNIYPFQNLKDYKQKIYSLADTSDADIVFNDSAVHASLITQCLFDHAKEIHMYCGKFSIFRQEFKQKLENMFNRSEYNEVRNNKEFEDFKPFDDTIDKMKSFFDKGGEMSVLVEEDIEPIKKDPIWKTIEEYTEKGQLKFCQYKGTIKLNHFTVADGKMYRSENNKEAQTAFCCFNDSETAEILDKCFDIMMQESKSTCSCRN